MEIADYLKVARRRWWILVLVPVLAAGAALAYGLIVPRTYSSTATVLSPSLVGTPYSQFSGPQATDQFVSAFSASVKDPTVIAQASKDTGVSVADLTGNVTVDQVGASSNVTLTYSGQERATAQSIAQTMASNALTNIYAAQGRIADVQVDSAKKALDASDTALDGYVVEVGVANPPAAYQAAISQVAGLQQARASFAARGDQSSAQAMIYPIKAAQQQVSRIGATLSQYNTLLSAQTLATATYQSVLGDQRQAQAQAAAAADAGVIQTSEAVPDMTGSSIAKLVVTVFGAGLLLAIILIAMMEFIAAVRRQPSTSDVTQARQQAVREEPTAEVPVAEEPVSGQAVATKASAKPAGSDDERIRARVVATSSRNSPRR